MNYPRANARGIWFSVKQLRCLTCVEYDTETHSIPGLTPRGIFVWIKHLTSGTSGTATMSGHLVWCGWWCHRSRASDTSHSRGRRRGGVPGSRHCRRAVCGRSRLSSRLHLLPERGPWVDVSQEGITPPWWGCVLYGEDLRPWGAALRGHRYCQRHLSRAGRVMRPWLNGNFSWIAHSRTIFSESHFPSGQRDGEVLRCVLPMSRNGVDLRSRAHFHLWNEGWCVHV